MSITYGFYNSMNHDRKYNAIQMSKMFDGIIKDGIFMSIGECFAVTAGSGMEIIVAPGKAWFNHTWTENDADLPVPVFQSEVVLNRIDALVLEINSTDSVRANTIKFIKGTPSSNPVIPTLTNTTTVHQHLLVTVTVPAGATSILQSMITNYIGTTTTPFVSGILETVSLDSLLGQWQAMLDQFVLVESSDFTTWFNQMKGQLTTDAAGNLQTQIDIINAKMLAAAKVIYVSVSGNNSTGDGTVTKPYATITKALTMLPKMFAGYYATIYVEGGTYLEDVSINNFSGGPINIIFLGSVALRSLAIGESQRVTLYSSTLNDITLAPINSSGLKVYDGSKVRIQNLNVSSSASGYQAVIFTTANSELEILDGTVTINNVAYAISVTENSKFFAETINGVGNSYVFLGKSGSTIAYGTRNITAANADLLTGGAMILNDVEKKSTVGVLSSLLTTVKTNIVNAINWMMGTLLPQIMIISAVLTKPTNPVYGQTYRYYFVPCRYANLYTISGLSVVVIGLGGITGVSVAAQYTNGFLIVDTLEVGNGYPIQINATLTKG